MYDDNRRGRVGGSLKTAAIVLTTTVALAAGIGAVTMTPNAEAAGQAVSTTGLNVRSGPGQKYRVIGTLKTGQKVNTVGPSNSGWTPINHSGQTAYVSAEYLRVPTSGAPDRSDNDTEASAPAGSTGTTAAVNVRTGPSLTDRSVTVLAKGAEVELTGKTSDGYSQIAYSGENRWVSSSFLSDSESGSQSAASTLPKKTTKGIATADLMIRSSASSKYKVIRVVPKGSKLTLTGVVTNNLAQIVDKKVLRWVNNTYVRPLGPEAPSGKLPKVKYYRYATVALDIRSASKNS